jgi:hypothetical protein
VTIKNLNNPKGKAISRIKGPSTIELDKRNCSTILADNDARTKGETPFLEKKLNESM